MMKIYTSVFFTAGMAFAGCQPQSDTMPSNDNPLLAEWDTPFGVPPFDLIGDEDYLPAFRTAITTHKSEIANITNDASSPAFENTIEALERSGKDLSRVSRVFFAINSAHSNDSIREIAKIMAPELSAHRDDINLNKDLFARVKAVYDQRDVLDLPAAQLRLLE